MMLEQIKTIKDFRSASTKEKGSEFIAIVFPVDNEELALNQLKEIRKKYYDASHYCYAYKFNNSDSKYSDDGEPSGTAGVRILNAIDHFELLDVLVVVVRYFGGTKLGVGPLGRAYYSASIEVLRQSNTVKQTLFQLVWIETEFNHISQIHRTISNYSGIIADSEFTNKARFKCYIKPSDLVKINIDLSNLTNGKILIQPKEDFEYFY